jgi:hypothetical protein
LQFCNTLAAEARLDMPVSIPRLGRDAAAVA